MKRISTAIFTSVVAIALSQLAIAQDANQGQPTEEKQPYCQFQDFQNHIYCTEGDIILFQPAQWGNDQLPLLAIYFLCNPDKPIYFDRAAVVCTYQKKTDSQFKDADVMAQLANQQQLQQQGSTQENPSIPKEEPQNGLPQGQ